jgi:Amt family ammonium transporter
VLDFAGGTVVHISSGVSALVCAILLGRRAGYPHEPMMPHNVVLSLIGTGLLWVGWFGFNAGSALTAGSLATSAFAATHFSAAAAALSWSLVEWMHKGRPSVLGAFAIGLVGGCVCYLAVTRLKARFGYDDSLDVFGVHGIGSMIGMLMLGGLASAAVNPSIATTWQAGGVVHSLVGGLHQLGNQGIAVVFTALYAAICTLILFKIVDALVGLRVDVETESIGLDLTQHGERAYSE